MPTDRQRAERIAKEVLFNAHLQENRQKRKNDIFWNRIKLAGIFTGVAIVIGVGVKAYSFIEEYNASLHPTTNGEVTSGEVETQVNDPLKNIMRGLQNNGPD